MTNDPKPKISLNSEAFVQIAEQALTGLMIFNLDTRKCEYANQIARETLELAEDTHDLSVENLFPENNGANRFRSFNAELLGLEGLFQEIIIKKTSGQKIVSNIGVRKLNLSNEQNKPANCVLLMIQETTFQVKLQREVEAKQTQITMAYQELLAQNTQLKELDMAKNRFIALITHELRTPVSGIVASSEVLKMKLFDTEEQHDEFVAMIHSEAQHLLELVNDVLDFAKIQAGKMDYYIEQKDLAKVVQQEVDLLTSMAEQNNISIELVASTTLTDCYFDEHRLKQVIANILNNAIKYNVPEGKVTVWLENKGESIELHVKDTGKGIRLEDQAKVFNEFETLGKISQHNKGTGLGMPITKRLLEGMGGQIALSSEVGVGSVFWITLPTDKVLSEEMYRSRASSSDLEDLAA